MTTRELGFALVAVGAFQCILIVVGACLGLAGSQALIRLTLYMLTLTFPFAARTVAKQLSLRFLMLMAVLLLLFNEVVWIPRFEHIPLS